MHVCIHYVRMYAKKKEELYRNIMLHARRNFSFIVINCFRIYSNIRTHIILDRQRSPTVVLEIQFNLFPSNYIGSR